ncbi:MAG: hypothetical protein O7E52_22590 [Candidatus Poribacteria bacterium]|nr:hypothetical protein [Candidatus Poribacteria bacterium]
MTIEVHANYERLREIARRSHEQGRTPVGITPEDVALARLYSYAFRLHAIGAFHATRLAIHQIPMCNALTEAYRERAVELLTDLANRTMDPVGTDFRAVISTFHHYATNIPRVIESLSKASDACKLESMRKIRDRFAEPMEEISAGNGIHTTQDTHAPEQASFVVPNLGITIVPLAYGDYHSWNLAYLDGERSDVPFHLHQEGVEIHLGYGPLHGNTVLGDCYAEVGESYAMPIPPMIRHGYVNDSTMAHHVPFIFGSLTRGGWGVFLDVEPQPIELDRLEKVPALSRQMNRTVLLQREIEKAAAKFPSVRYPIIPAAATDRNGTGGLELSVARINDRGLRLRMDHFCIISVVRGRGVVQMAGVEKAVSAHDHFAVPADIPAFLRQEGEEPLVTVDAIIKSSRSARDYRVRRHMTNPV